jgi:hypothetical protein
VRNARLKEICCQIIQAEQARALLWMRRFDRLKSQYNQMRITATKRYEFALFLLILLPFQAAAFLDENEEIRPSAAIFNDFPNDGRYDAYKGVKPVIPMDTADSSCDM